MPDGKMSFREFIGQELTGRGRRRVGGGTLAESASSPQARLDITRSAEKLEFLCTAPRMRFFSLNAYLAGNLNISRSLSEDKLPTTRIEIPIEVGGNAARIVLLFCKDDSERQWPLTEASVVASPDGTLALRFVFGDEKTRVLYKFECPSGLEILDFQPRDNSVESVYTPPTVAQLGAVLRATLKDRRDALSVAEDLGAALSPRTQAIIAQIRQNLPGRSSLASPPVILLSEFLTRELDRVAPNPSLVAALCLLLDIEAQVITPGAIEAFARGKGTLPASFQALRMVARHFGLDLRPAEWKERVESTGAAFLEIGGGPVQAMVRAMHAVVERMARPREILGVLMNLVRETPSPRVEVLTTLWSSRSDASPTPLLGVVALVELAAAFGRKVDPGTMSAFCLYAEVESGTLSEERFVGWLEARRTLTVGPYAMQAVATAFDLDLIGFTLTVAQRSRLPFFAGLFDLSPGGIIQSLVPVDGSSTTYRYLSSAEKVMRVPEGWQPGGDVLLHTSLLERMTEREVRLFLKLGNAFYACFQSDLDRRRMWKQLTPAILDQETVASGEGTETSTRSLLSFIDGFRVYHFQGTVLGRLVPLQAGADRGRSPLICKDHRNSLHFFDPQSPPSSGGVMRDAGLAVQFPSVASLPSTLAEMTLDRHVGATAGASDVRKLEMLRAGLVISLSHREAEGVVIEGRGLQTLRQKLASARVQQMLRQVVETRTLETLISQFLSLESPVLELRVFEPLTGGLQDDEVLEFAALSLVYELCVTDLTESRTFHKSYKSYLFRATLRNQLLHLCDAENPKVRAIGCRLLCTRPCVGDATERSIVEYELLHRLADRDDSVSEQTGAALARLALEEELGLPAIWLFRKVETNQKATALESRRAHLLIAVAQ